MMLYFLCPFFSALKGFRGIEEAASGRRSLGITAVTKHEISSEGQLRKEWSFSSRLGKKLRVIQLRERLHV
jgi:hypothetical protein